MVRFPGNATDFFLLQRVRTGCGSHPACTASYLPLWVKQPVHDASNSQHLVCRLWISGSTASLPPYVFKAFNTEKKPML
jgi:hypothetical protein